MNITNSRNGNINLDKFILTIELVPKTSWYSNVRSNVSSKEWDRIRKKCYSIANNKCEICGDIGKNQGVNHNVECHEIWEYDDNNHIQTLKGLIALCPFCHKTKHVGLARIKGEEHIVIKQLMKCNKMTKHEAESYINDSFNIWAKRSLYKWELDISLLNNY